MFWHRIFGESIEQELPSGWQVDLLDNVAIRGSGHTPDQEHSEYWNGGIKWVSLADSSKLDKIYIRETAKQISQLGIKNSSAVLHPTGTVVLSRDAGVGKSAILASDMAVSQHFISWRCGPKINNHFLYYVLQFMKPEFERQAVGSTIKTIGLGYFKKLQVVMPPLAEQRKIAAILGTWDAAIDKAERLVAALRARKRALMQRLLTGEVRFVGFEGKWEDVRLDTVAQINPGKPKHLESNTEVSFVGMSDLSEDGRLVRHEITSYGELGNGFTSFQDSDILIAKITPCLENGKGALVHGLRNGVGFGSTEFHVVRSNQNRAIPEFLYYHSISEPFRKSAERNMVGSAGQKRVQPNFVSAYNIPLPPLPEQTKITDALKTEDKLLGLMSEYIEALRIQKKGLMQRLLTGEVRVAGGEER